MQTRSSTRLLPRTEASKRIDEVGRKLDAIHELHRIFGGHEFGAILGSWRSGGSERFGVLVVDDNRDLADSMVEVLRVLDYDVGRSIAGTKRLL